MINNTILHYKITEKLDKARTSWLGQAETGLDRQKGSLNYE